MKKIITTLIVTHSLLFSYGQILSERKEEGAFEIFNGQTVAAIYFDKSDFTLIHRAAELLQQDIEMVSGNRPGFNVAKNVIIIGTIERSVIIQNLVKEKKLNVDKLKGQWETYQVSIVSNPAKGIEKGLVIAGSDRRGAAYGVFELSRQMGVSPWYWWADVPVKKKNAMYARKNSFTDAPKVKYRGIFINDEAPALSNWSKEKFGGFNSKFYEKVFELILRLKGNYLWPAMWGNAFYDDDPANIKMADDYGIVIGTSHHEPLMRAHDEWRRYGNNQKWIYDSSENALQDFWKKGIERGWNEKIVSVGMRGDGDMPMIQGTAIDLLERIVKDQRKIIEDVTKKPASETPQLWALYKEVQDYYDKGMRVPDDVTLLLCDDNWGNIRKLPKLNDAPRKGGYGIYYHFDYVGGPRNYKWVNTNPLPRVWEQMHLAWEYGVKQIWIVNVGDIKPMEFPISFWLDYSWNPERIGADDLQKYTEQWAAEQFGSQYAKDIAEIISKYAKYNSRRKPELLDQNTYSLDNYDEFERVVKEYYKLLKNAEKINARLGKEYESAFFQLVLHPVRACANLYDLYFKTALNKQAYANRSADAELFAEEVKALYIKDSLITLQYHQLNNGKWNHMMSQTHIGYTYWQQPPVQKMPEVKYVPKDSVTPTPQVIKYDETNAGYVSIEASRFTKAINTNGITWKILPDHGRTSSSLTPFPVTAKQQTISATSPHVQYEIITDRADSITLYTFFSPTLNFHNTETGLQFAVSVDNEKPQVISLNKEDNNPRFWNGWVANNIIIKQSRHKINAPGKHTVKFWMVHPGVVLQKLVIDFGGLKPSYLGPPATGF